MARGLSGGSYALDHAIPVPANPRAFASEVPDRLPHRSSICGADTLCLRRRDESRRGTHECVRHMLVYTLIVYGVNGLERASDIWTGFDTSQTRSRRARSAGKPASA